MSFLIFGGANDNEVLSFSNYALEYFKTRDTNIELILIENTYSPTLIWDYDKDLLIINNKIVNPSIVWIRRDAFQEKENLQIRARRWDHILKGWLMAHPNVKILNREWLNKFNNKVYQLDLAQKIGLKIPHTILTNSYSILNHLNNTSNSIIKPIDNGYCENYETKKVS